MKMNQLVRAGAICIALVIAAPSALALGVAQKAEIKKAVTSVSAPEMPAAAAQLVVKAAKKDREAVATEAVRQAIFKNRSVAAAVVAAVIKVAPEVASAVTLTATQMEREQVAAIAHAAIAAAPAARAEITTSARTAFVASRPVTVVANNAGSPVTSGTSVTTGNAGTTGNNSFSSVRGGASQGGSYTVTQSNQPINTQTGGAGNGTYSGAFSIDSPTSTIVDYSQPRN